MLQNAACTYHQVLCLEVPLTIQIKQDYAKGWHDIFKVCEKMLNVLGLPIVNNFLGTYLIKNEKNQWKVMIVLHTFLTASFFFSFLSLFNSDFNSNISPFLVVVKYFESVIFVPFYFTNTFFTWIKTINLNTVPRKSIHHQVSFWQVACLRLTSFCTDFTEFY